MSLTTFGMLIIRTYSRVQAARVCPRASVCQCNADNTTDVHQQHRAAQRYRQIARTGQPTKTKTEWQYTSTRHTAAQQNAARQQPKTQTRNRNVPIHIGNDEWYAGNVDHIIFHCDDVCSTNKAKKKPKRKSKKRGARNTHF